MLHYIGKFKIRIMVQALLFCKSNPDSNYANGVFKFIKIQAVKNRYNVAFFSTVDKCKVPVGDLEFPIASVTGSKESSQEAMKHL